MVINPMGYKANINLSTFAHVSSNDPSHPQDFIVHMRRNHKYSHLGTPSEVRPNGRFLARKEMEANPPTRKARAQRI